MAFAFLLSSRRRRAGLCPLLASTVVGLASATASWVAVPGLAHAQAATASASFTVKDARPEAYSWFWDNADEALFKAANLENRSFRWLQAPATPQHLGYSAGARYEASSYFGGALHKVVVSYLAPATQQGRVASDNFLGAKPYSFLAAEVSIDGKPPFTVLVQYNAVGQGYGDSQFRIEATAAADRALAQDYVSHLGRTLRGLQGGVMKGLDERYFNGVLKKRGFYSVGKVDKNLNVTLTIVQEIRGITPEMLNWWWDHIGNTERYRLWQPIDHVTFEWTVPPNSPDLMYDVGAVQKVKEYVGKSAWTLTIAGADPHAAPLPPVPITDPGYFYARTNLSLLQSVLPSNSLVHQWKPNATGDGVVLTSTFVNTALALVLNSNFFNDLGSHGLREFQMLPYFLPRLYRREQLGE